MSNGFYKYIPFAPSNYDNLDGSDDKAFYVKTLVDGYFELTLYRNYAEQNRLDKTEYLENVSSIYGILREETSITEMSITIEYNKVVDFNYVYIPIFGRYYYVTDITSVRKNLWDLSLSVDVLMSYKDAIKQCQAFIDRNENVYNDLVVDNKIPLEVGEVITSTFIENELFGVTSGQYVLQGLLVDDGEEVDDGNG